MLITTASAQSILDQKITIRLTEQKFDVVLSKIKEQTGIDFSYYSYLFKENQRFSVYKTDKSVREVIDFLLTGTNISYGVFKGQLIFSRPVYKPSSEYTISCYLLNSISGAKISEAHIYLDLIH